LTFDFRFALLAVFNKAIDNNTIQASFQIDGEPVILTLVIDANGKVL